jgi:hypothetical protein
MHKQRVRQPAFRRFAMNLLRDFRQRPRIRVDSDVKLFGILARRLINKTAIARSNINNDVAAIRSAQVLKIASMELREAFTANDF